MGVFGSETVAVRRHIRESETGGSRSWWLCAELIAVGVIEGQFRYLDKAQNQFKASIVCAAYQAAAPDEQPSNRRKQDPDDEKSRKHRFGGENRLPCLQTLLLESRICRDGQSAAVSI